MYGQLEHIKYINHLGEELLFGHDGLYVNENDLHDFQWSVVSVNDKISSFERQQQTKTLPVRIACVSQVEGIIKRNRLFSIPEKDVLAAQYGRLVVNGYYCECFVTGSKKSVYSVSGQYMAVTLTIVTDRPYWVKETKLEVSVDASWQPTSTGGYEYPYDFTYDYLPYVNRSQTVANASDFDANFRMVIHGLVVNPTVTIDDHEYQVNATVNAGKVLVIDSATQEIYLSDEDGDNREDVFDLRGRDSYIFQMIPAGALSVRWDNTFDFDIYILEQLSEPRWVLHD